MTFAEQKSCLTCAWRETCQKRFASTEDLGLRCPEYTVDVRLQKRSAPAGQDAPPGPAPTKGREHA